MYRDDHQQSLLHWACFDGHVNIVDMLITRGARATATNMGDDTPLHVAASRGRRDVVLLVGYLLNILLVKMPFCFELHCDFNLLLLNISAQHVLEFVRYTFSKIVMMLSSTAI